MTPSPTLPTRGREILLEISNLQKRFGGVVAVDGCTLSVAERSITVDNVTVYR